MVISNTLSYTGLVTLSISGFYILYLLLFSKGHHFHFNRFLILLALVFSFVFPFFSFNLHHTPLETINHFNFPQYADFWEPDVVENLEKTFVSEERSQDLLFWLFLIYCLGTGLFLIRYTIKLLTIIKLIRKNETIKLDQYTIVKLKEGTSTFSFANYIFTDQMPASQNRAIFDHEKYHVEQKHTCDLLLVELLLALQWFNPFIHSFKNRLVEVHEFLADQYVLTHGNDKSSFLRLLGSTVGIDFQPDFTSQFHSNIYKRILMINTKKTISLKVWKLAFPLLFTASIIIIHSGFKHKITPTKILNKNNLSVRVDDAEDPTFQQPIKKEDLIKVASNYGMRMHPILKEKRMHKGIDYSANEGVKIHATLAGVVREAKFKEKYGNTVIIDHENGFSSLYSQMEKISVKEGEKVSSGRVIGTVGSTGLSTGPHLHFEIMKDGENVNPDDYLEPYE